MHGVFLDIDLFFFSTLAHIRNIHLFHFNADSSQRRNMTWAILFNLAINRVLSFSSFDLLIRILCSLMMFHFLVKIIVHE